MQATRSRTPADRISGYQRYWDEERETMPKAAREQLILDRIRHQLDYAYHRLPFYRRHYDAHGFRPEMVRSLEDFTTKVPVITKKMLVQDQLENPPFGSYLGVDRSELARIHGSSGTMGTPTLYGVSVNDWRRAAEISAMGLWCAGIRPHDVVQITFPFTLFFGGWGVLQAVERIGACAFPTGSMIPTDRQIEFIYKLGVDVLIGTPSYLVHLGHRAVELGYRTETASTTLAIVGGEPGGSIPSVRAIISQLWNKMAITDVAAGSTSEMYPFISNPGCLLNQDGGVHLFIDENYTEVVSKDDPNQPVPPGTSGATVATHLWRESQPMIRFWMGDEAVLDDSPCPCGRTYPRLPKGVYGRLDDMILVRGANVYPSAVEAIIRATEGCGGEFRMIVERPVDLDELRVEVERAPGWPVERSHELRLELEDRLRTGLQVRVPVTIVEPGTQEVQTFKARRVIDRRPAR